MRTRGVEVQLVEAELGFPARLDSTRLGCLPDRDIKYVLVSSASQAAITEYHGIGGL